MVADDLFDFAKTVSSREDFVKFVGYLNRDYQQKRNEWQNKTLWPSVKILTHLKTVGRALREG